MLHLLMLHFVSIISLSSVCHVWTVSTVLHLLCLVCTKCSFNSLKYTPPILHCLAKQVLTLSSPLPLLYQQLTGTNVVCVCVCHLKCITTLPCFKLWWFFRAHRRPLSESSVVFFWCIDTMSRCVRDFDWKTVWCKMWPKEEQPRPSVGSGSFFPFLCCQKSRFFGFSFVTDV